MMDEHLYGRGPVMSAVEALNEFNKLPLEEQRLAMAELCVEIIPSSIPKGLGMSETATGVSGNTIADLREVAAVWDKSALYCDECGETELASRDRRFAAAMREAASILEALRY